MILKKYIEFVNENYNHTEEEHRALDFIEKYLKEVFYSKGYFLSSVKFLSDYGIGKIKNVIASENGNTTHMDLYFTKEEFNVLPLKNTVIEVLDNLLFEYEYIDDRYFSSTPAHDFYIGFNIKKIMNSDLFKSSSAVNKFKL